MTDSVIVRSGAYLGTCNLNTFANDYVGNAPGPLLSIQCWNVLYQQHLHVEGILTYSVTACRQEFTFERKFSAGARQDE
jgi:hypothetical protein